MPLPDDSPPVDDIDVLKYLRATILVTDRFGEILQVEGGADRPLSYRPEELVGHNALEFIAAEDHQTMAEQFLGSDDVPTIGAPQPFPLRVIGSDGITRVWDCVPSGFNEQGREGWVTMMTCRQEQNVSIDAMECFLQGGSSLDIASVFAEQCNVSSDDGWRKVSLVLHRSALAGSTMTPWQVLTGVPDTEPTLAIALADCVHDSTAPWHQLSPGTARSDAELPESLQKAAHAVGLSHCTMHAVGVEDEARIIFLRFSNFPHEPQGNNRLADQAVDAVLQRALGSERARAMLDQALRQDPLTGIANRLHFDEVIAANDRSNHAALFVDIDNFKSVNDTFGHAAGDAALREVAARIVASCRPQDLVARIGGDEFAVILRDVSSAEAEHIVGRIRELIAEPLNIDGGPEAVSVTVGIANPAPDVSLAELIQRADHAMLEDKHSARGALG